MVFWDHYHLLKDEYEVMLCVFDPSVLPVDLPVAVQALVEAPRSQNLLYKLFRFYRMVKRLKALKRNEQIDTCISHMRGANYINLLSGTCKTIQIFHGSISADPSLQGKVGKLQQRWVLPYTCRIATHTITVSKGLKKELVDNGAPAEKITAIPNFFDADLIDQKAHEPLEEGWSRLLENRTGFLNVGRLAEQKNHFLLLRLFKKLLDTNLVNPRPVLFIVGDGELRNDLIKYAEELGLVVSKCKGPTSEKEPGPDVVFCLHQVNPFRFMKRIPFFLLTSIFEGFPLVLGEAMLNRQFVISIDCPTGPEEFLRNHFSGKPVRETVLAEYGVLFPYQVAGEKAIAEAIAGIIKDRQVVKEVQGKARTKALTFSATEVQRQWKAKIREVVTGV